MKLASLSEPLDAADFGGKAAGLSQALRAGLPVPPGFALAFDLVDAITQESRTAIEFLDRTCGTLGWPVAARSSALGEDSESASFAGQHITRLNLGSVPDVLDAIRAIWESGRSPSALAYRSRLGLVGEPRVGVVVQRLVVPECAGVMFTRNPMDGSSEIVIEASWGLGEAVVAGLVTPDRFRVSHDGNVLERVPGIKEIAIQVLADGGTAEVEVPSKLVRALCLDDRQLDALHSLAQRCEAALGVDQDLEWAFADGSLFLLQRRALTRVGSRREHPPEAMPAPP